MNALASQCSSGCESGWTLYLEQSFLKKDAPFVDGNGGFFAENKDKRAKDEDDDDDDTDEDLSMVSDASSGPPHFPDDDSYFNEDNGCFYPPPSKTAKTKNKSNKKRQKVKENYQPENQHLPSFLDDTASSPVSDYSMDNITVTKQQASAQSVLDYSQGFSATYFEARSSFEENFGFLQPSLSENELQDNQWFGGKGMGMRQR